MAASDDRRRAEYEAFESLSKLQLLRRESRERRSEWEAAEELLGTRHTRRHAVSSSDECARRIALLRVQEPRPALEDYYPDTLRPFPNGKCVLMLDFIHRSFDLGSSGFVRRERVRQEEIYWTENLLVLLRRAELDRIQASRMSRGDLHERETLGASLSLHDYAALAETPEQLETLFREKKKNWIFVGFVSVLIQGKVQLKELTETRENPYRHAMGNRVADACDLERLVNAVIDEIERLADQLACFTQSAAFQRLFRAQDEYSEPELRDVAASADAVIEFYTRMLLLARTVRELDARGDLGDLLDEVAQLVDRPLNCVDHWINEILGYTGMLAALDGGQLTSEEMTYQLPLEISLDELLLRRIRRRLTGVPGRLSDSAYLERWQLLFNSSSTYLEGLNYYESPAKDREWVSGAVFAALALSILFFVWVVAVVVG